VSCESIQERLDLRALARTLDDGSPEAVELATHARGCDACGAHRRFLVALGAELALPEPEPVAPAVVEAAQRRAVRVLRAREAPEPIGREIVAALAVALLALPLVVAHAYLVIEGGAWLLAAWLPEPLLTWLGAIYLLSLALGVGALYGLIPLAVAFRRRATAESG
jgi:hypothetical protein